MREHMPPERVAVIINLFRMWHVATEGWACFNWNLPSTRYPVSTRRLARNASHAIGPASFLIEGCSTEG